MIGKGFFDSKYLTDDYWILNFLLSVTTILQSFEKKLSHLKDLCAKVLIKRFRKTRGQGRN